MLVTLFMPIVLLLLFGFAISTEVNSVRVVAVVDVQTDQTRELLSRLGSNEYFRFYGVVSMAEAEPMLRRGAADAAVMIRHDHGRPMAQIMVDASNTPVAKTMTAYLTSVVAGSQGSKMTAHTLFNPQMRSAYNFVPGIMGMIFILVCAIMTSVSIVSEKESGTMDLLLVSPVRPRVIVFGKLVPYFILSCVILAVMLLIAYTVLGLPVSSTIFNVVLISMLYVVLSLSIGQGELGCTPLQMANLAATVANRGYYYIPHIVRSVEGQDSLDTRFYERHYTKVDTKYFDEMVEGMWRGVNVDGTGRLAYLKDLDVCGKTGTAQNPRGADHSTFISFAPRNTPRIAIAVYVEHGGFGAEAAVPIASLIEEMYLTGEVKRPELVEYVKNKHINYSMYGK